MDIDFDKNGNGLVPAIIQDSVTRKVLMLGYMNQEAVDQTNTSGKVTFYSRTKKRLWTKGEESGNFLHLVSIKADCDRDTLLITAQPNGPTCHTGADTCWQEENLPDYGFLTLLENIISERKTKAGQDKVTDGKPSYVQSLFRDGINKIAQKVGEEAIELVIESKDNNDELFVNESADLLFHYLILLQAKGFRLADVAEILRKRH